jgi:hypothetical protein
MTKYLTTKNAVDAKAWSGSIESAQRIIDWAGPEVVSHNRDADVLELRDGGWVHPEQYLVRTGSGEWTILDPAWFEANYQAVD